MDVQEVCCEGVDYIYLAQDLDGFRALLNAKMNYELHKKRRIDWDVEQVLDSIV